MNFVRYILAGFIRPGKCCPSIYCPSWVDGNNRTCMRRTERDFFSTIRRMFIIRMIVVYYQYRRVLIIIKISKVLVFDLIFKSCLTVALQ